MSAPKPQLWIVHRDTEEHRPLFSGTKDACAQYVRHKRMGALVKQGRIRITQRSIDTKAGV